MPCEQYKDALIEAASTGAAPQGELRAHLAECASCREAFVQEQSLFGAIDSGLRTTANAEVPPSLLPRVRAGLDETVVAPQLRWLQPFIFASASVALAFAVFLMTGPHHAAQEEVAKQGPVVVPAATRPATKTNPENISSEGTQFGAIHVNHSHASRNSTIAHSAASSNPEVLVPPDEREAFARFLSRDQRPPAPTSVSTQSAPRPPEESVEILPVEIASLAVTPLSKGENDNRQTEF